MLKNSKIDIKFEKKKNKKSISKKASFWEYIDQIDVVTRLLIKNIYSLELQNRKWQKLIPTMCFTVYCLHANKDRSNTY